MNLHIVLVDYSQKPKEEFKNLDKACFQHDMTYGDFKDLTRRVASHKILHLILLKILASIVLIKKLLVVVLKMAIF